jgi:glucuronokinase
VTMRRGAEAIFCAIPARIGLLGNPSDGYNGQCISSLCRNWRAKCALTPHENRWDPSIKIDCAGEILTFDSLAALAENPGDLSHGGLPRLVLGALVHFQDDCVGSGFAMEASGFEMVVSTDIPRQVGLAGSSAVTTSVIRCLLTHHGLGTALPPHAVADMALKVETDRLEIHGGLQDRLPQAYNRMLHMDFREELMDGRGWGAYSHLDEGLLPEMWIAHAEMGEESGRVHAELPARWEAQEPVMVRVIRDLAWCSHRGKEALEAGDFTTLAEQIDRNFDLRTELFGEAALGQNLTMVRLARELGSCAKQPGSGGAIIGIIPDEDFMERAKPAFAEHGWTLVRLEM